MQDVAHIGPWRLGIKPSRIPCHPAAVEYFRLAAAGALERLTRAGFHHDNIAGPVQLEAVDHRSTNAGYYESDTDELVVTAKHEPATDYGANLGAVYGESPGDGMLAWACCHENAHRIWYRRLTDEGRAFWLRVHEALTRGVPETRILGMARRAGGGIELAELGGVTPGEVLRFTAELDPLDRVLGAVLFKASRTTDPLDFYRWLHGGTYRAGLASGYAKKKAKESWSEAIASVVMEGGSPRPDRPESEVGFRVMREAALAALWLGVRAKAGAR